MRFLLHRFVLAPAVMVAAALATNVAKAETTVKVPFSFIVAGKTFPAGLYSIARDEKDHAYVTLVAKGSGQTYSCLLTPGAPDPTERKVALNFDLVGQTHLLQSIQYGPMITAKLDKKSLANERQYLQNSGGR
jgi:hypothetical protein